MSIFIQETHPKIRVIASVHYAFVVSIENTFCQLQSDQRILFRKTGVKWTLHDLCHGSNQHYHPVSTSHQLWIWIKSGSSPPFVDAMRKGQDCFGFYFFYFFGMWGRYESNWLLDYLQLSFIKYAVSLYEEKGATRERQHRQLWND